MPSHAEDMRKLFIKLARELVNNPDAVSVHEFESPDNVRLLVRVDPADIGMIVGTKGRSLDSLRKILQGLGGREGRRYILDIEE
jgi:uncharacterized protein